MLVLMHTATILIVDRTVVMLMYLCAVQLKILENQLKNDVACDELTELIRKHQDILV